MICPKCQTENPDDAEKCYICGFPFDRITNSTIRLTPSKISDQKDQTDKETSPANYDKLKPGFNLGKRYLILEEIGTGGMGKVYKALDNEINEIVALKTIRPEIASDEASVQRFKNEMKIARKITHKNVCRIFQFEEIEGIKCISMEFISGEDLNNFVKRAGQLPMQKTLEITKQICEGLKEAHSFGIIHQDLKPHNIMIDKSGHAYITDFGIARFRESTIDQKSGTIVGTPEYISPEQVEGKGVDNRSDIYSLGVILYELTTGRIPFDSDTPLSIAVKHLREQVKDPREYNPQLSENISKIILKCLNKDRDKRYPSVEKLLIDINEEMQRAVEEKGPKAKAGFFGNLKILPVDEILKILFNSKKSGILHLNQDKTRINLYIDKGNIFRVDSDNPSHRIGQILLKRKKVTEEDIELCLKIQKKVDDKFCQILSSLNLISKEDIEDMMSFRFEEIIFDSLKWFEGHFDFEETPFDKKSNEFKDLVTTNITSEIIDKMKQWRGWLSEMPPDDSILFGSKSDLNTQDIMVTEEVREVVTLANGENTIEDITNKSSYGKYLTVRALYELFKKGILIQLGAKFKEGEIPVKPSQVSEISKLHNMIKNIYSASFAEINDKLVSKLGPKSEKLIVKILKKVAKSYDLTFDIQDIEGLSSYQFDNFFKKAERIPEQSTRVHNILSILNELLQEEIKLISNMFGGKTKKETIDSIKNKINPVLKKNMYLSEKYGLSSDLSRILKY
jgi:serine/threonine protein kinase